MRLPTLLVLVAALLALVAAAPAWAAALDDVTLATVPNGCSKDQAGFQLRNTTKDRPIRVTIQITTTRPAGKSLRTTVADVNPGEMKSVGCASNITDTTLEYSLVGAFYLDYLRPEDRKPQ
jgi:hypothetical protein